MAEKDVDFDSVSSIEAMFIKCSECQEKIMVSCIDVVDVNYCPMCGIEFDEATFE